MSDQFYIPILKSKSGEFDALLKMKESWKALLIPLLEVTPVEYDFETREVARSLEEHLDRFCLRVEKKWSGHTCFIDTGMINDLKTYDDHLCLHYIFNHFRRKDVVPIPTIHISDSQPLLDTVREILEEHKISDVAIRVTIDDVTSMDFTELLENIYRQVSITPKQCHLIFDLKNGDFSQRDEFAEGLLNLFRSFPFFAEWKSFAVCCSAFPPMGSIKGPVAQIVRLDWQFFKALQSKLSLSDFGRTLTYGDYGIVSPSYSEFNPKKMSSSANIRYTATDFWLVVKGKALKKKEDWKQYVSQAKEIIKSEVYSGKKFSAGDMHLFKCAKGLEKPGNPTVWNWVGNNHHFTKVISDLFAINPVS